MLPPLGEDQALWEKARSLAGVRGVLAKPLAKFLNPCSSKYDIRPRWWLRSIPYQSPYKLSKSLSLYIPVPEPPLKEVQCEAIFHTCISF